MKRCITFFLYLLLYQNYLFPQTDAGIIEHFSIENGLSQNTIWCILQDRDGFLWLGTNDGLDKYDGYNFIIYRHNPNNSESISGNRIYSMCEDTSGNLWIGTYGGGLNFYDINKDKFIHYVNDPGDKQSLSGNEITTVFEDKHGTLWVGTDGEGIDGFDRTNHNFFHFKNNPENTSSLSDNKVLSIAEDNFGNLWVGTRNGGLNLLDRNKKTFRHFIHDSANDNSLSDNEVLSLYVDNSQTLWIGTGKGGLDKYDYNSNSFIKYKFQPENHLSLGSNRIYSIYQDHSGTLWVGTIGGGLNKFNKAEGIFTRYVHKSDDPNSISGNSIFSIYEDKSGILWAGTYNDGLNRIIDYGKENFMCYKHIPDNPNSLSDNNIYSVFEDNEKKVWIGTGNGVNEFDAAKKQFIKFLPDNSLISSGEILAIYKDSEDILWLSIYEKGLIGITKNNRIIRYQKEEGSSNCLSSNKIFALYEDHSNNLWIGTDGGGLDKLDKQRKFFTHYLNNPTDKTSLGSNRVFTIFEDRAQNLWVGTDGGGLNLFNKSNGNFIRYLHQADNPGSISSNSILSICEDTNSNLWLGTYGGGLDKFDAATKQFINFSMEDGMPNDVVYGILEDLYDNLWLSTNNGLSKFNIKTKSFRNYDVKDGLQGNEFNQGAYFKNKNGKMFFGGTYGLNIFYPNNITDNDYVPQIAITDFELSYKPVPIGLDTSLHRIILQNSISRTDSIFLEHNDNTITFEFSALDFHRPQKNKYKYILYGFDKEWHTTDARRRFATYTNLDPGNYTFRVKGSNNDEIWNNKGKILTIIINPPWWATWWAYSIYGILFITVFGSTSRFYLNRQKLKEELRLEQQHAKKLAEVDKMKSHFFTNISHEFRTPLTLILGPSENIMNNSLDINAKNQAETIRKNAGRLLRLINQLLDLSKLDEKKLKLQAKEGNIVSFIKGIVMSFEAFAERKDLSLKINSQKNEIEIYFDRNKMENVFTNLLSNAIKFTPKGGKVEIKIIEKDDDIIEISIKDTGIGIPEKELPKLFDRFYQVDSSQTREYEGSGLGLSLTKELIELHHGTIKVKSKASNPALKKPGWTELIIELPRGKYHLNEDEILDANDLKAESGNVDLDDGYFHSKSQKEVIADDNENQKTIILVVEDNRELREYIRDFLNEEFVVEEAFNGEQGIRKAENVCPDLIISDIMMPKMDGNQMAEVLKNNELTSHIPIIFLTAKADY